tara:strand:+ start:2245 stop:2820 length:576 start_codon:yes stop_codon:yes gene_type:complete
MKLTKKAPTFILIFTLLSSGVVKAETIVGKGFIEPGIALTFEAAARDSIIPTGFYLEEENTDVHIEALITWTSGAPAGFPIGGHVGYLQANVELINEQTGEQLFFALVPHLNLNDGLHYAQNVKLPGSAENTFTLSFTIKPPTPGRLGLHKDWVAVFGEKFVEEKAFVYKRVNLTEAVQARRKNKAFPHAP